MCISEALCFQRDTIDHGKRYVSYGFLSQLTNEMTNETQQRNKETTVYTFKLLEFTVTNSMQ